MINPANMHMRYFLFAIIANSIALSPAWSQSSSNEAVPVEILSADFIPPRNARTKKLTNIYGELPAAKADDAQAQYKIGYYFRYGDMPKRNYDTVYF